MCNFRISKSWRQFFEKRNERTKKNVQTIISCDGKSFGDSTWISHCPKESRNERKKAIIKSIYEFMMYEKMFWLRNAHVCLLINRQQTQTNAHAIAVGLRSAVTFRLRLSTIWFIPICVLFSRRPKAKTRTKHRNWTKISLKVIKLPTVADRWFALRSRAFLPFGFFFCFAHNENHQSIRERVCRWWW